MKINARFTAERDTYCWVLTETYEGKDAKTGEPKPQTRETYHPNLLQALQWVLDRSLGDCSDLREVIVKLRDARALLEQEAKP